MGSASRHLEGAAVTAALLDIDGTLVDSNDGHACAWAEALAEGGHDVPLERVRRLIGMGSDTLLPAAIGLAKETPEGEHLSERCSEIYKARYLPSVRPFPQAKELVARMRTEGLRVVIATSSQREQLDAMLAKIGIADLIHEAATGSDAPHSKPAPDLVQVALARAGCPAAEAVLVGDTPYDIQAARGAGVRTIALRCGGWSDADLNGAAALYDDPADLLVRYDTSPLGHHRG